MTDMSVQDQPYEAGMGDYFALMKPRVMSLVIFTALVGLLVAPTPVHPFIGFLAILCIAVGAGRLWRAEHVVGRGYRRENAPHCQTSNSVGPRATR
jgi:heme O synthase-like polyprenyltransferase